MGPASRGCGRAAGDALGRWMGQSGNKMETLTPKMGIIVRPNVPQVVDSEDNGEVAERLNAPVLKTGIPSRGSRVRISPSPPIFSFTPPSSAAMYQRRCPAHVPNLSRHLDLPRAFYSWQSQRRSFARVTSASFRELGVVPRPTSTAIPPSPPPIAHIPGANCHILPTTPAQSSR